jgi:hypothetical protein
MKQIQLLRVCLTANLMLLLIVITLMIKYGNDSKYCRIGPQPDLEVFAFKINTWEKYYIFLGLVAFIRIAKVLIQEIAGPILGFTVYNPDKKVVTEFSKNELQFYANSMFFISSLRNVFEIIVTISQLDIACFSVFVAQGTSIVTIRFLLNKKTFKKDTSFDLKNIVIN